MKRRMMEFAEEQGLVMRIIVYTGKPDGLFAALGIRTGTIPHTVVYDPMGMVVERLEETMTGEADLDRLRHAIQVAKARR